MRDKKDKPDPYTTINFEWGDHVFVTGDKVTQTLWITSRFNRNINRRYHRLTRCCRNYVQQADTFGTWMGVVFFHWAASGRFELYQDRFNVANVNIFEVSNWIKCLFRSFVNICNQIKNTVCPPWYPVLLSQGIYFTFAQNLVLIQSLYSITLWTTREKVTEAPWNPIRFNHKIKMYRSQTRRWLRYEKQVHKWKNGYGN